jgi:diphthamide synthase (EF-2-diphthine--ammonia ligase)
VSWSTGKDSAYALHLARQDPGIEVAGLFTTIEVDRGKVAYNGVPAALAQAQAAALRLPLYLLPVPAGCPAGTREALRRGVLEREALPAGISIIIFGDAGGCDIRASRTARLAGLRIGAAFPLWGTATRPLARSILAAGIRAVITRADPEVLYAGWAGKPFSTEFLSAIGSRADPCGENGEFHTFTCDSPDFGAPVPVTVQGFSWRDGSVYAELAPGAQPGRKCEP